MNCFEIVECIIFVLRVHEELIYHLVIISYKKENEKKKMKKKAPLSFVMLFQTVRVQLYDIVLFLFIEIRNWEPVGVNVRQSVEILANDKPHIVVGTPGRILDLVGRKAMDLSHVKHFVIQNIFKVRKHRYNKPSRGFFFCCNGMFCVYCVGYPSYKASHDVLGHP
jgi:hypothetical protein